jgi:hypothetical protein
MTTATVYAPVRFHVSLNFSDLARPWRFTESFWDVSRPNAGTTTPNSSWMIRR